MNIIRALAEKTMTEEKRKQAKNDFFAYYVGRPLSYVLTVPFLKLKLKPNVISFISIIPSILGFILIGFEKNLTLKLIGCMMFFLWNLLDGVDGNVARYTKQFSKTGPLWDATSGYIAMFLTYISMGTGCYYGEFYFLEIDQALMILLGGLSGVLSIFPRLVMHKRITSLGIDENTSQMKNKNSYGIIKIIGLNLISTAGIIQVIMLLAIVFKVMDLFTVFYFIINLCVCIGSLFKLLREPQING